MHEMTVDYSHRLLLSRSGCNEMYIWDSWIHDRTNMLKMIDGSWSGESRMVHVKGGHGTHGTVREVEGERFGIVNILMARVGKRGRQRGGGEVRCVSWRLCAGCEREGR